MLHSCNRYRGSSWCHHGQRFVCSTMFYSAFMPKAFSQNTTNFSTDGFNSLKGHGILTCYGHQITIPYHPSIGLPVMITASGITEYTEFCAALTTLTPPHAFSTTVSCPPHMQLKQNLTPVQKRKLMIHECCNHKNWKTINTWIRQGHLNVDPSVANSMDPICFLPIWESPLEITCSRQWFHYSATWFSWCRRQCRPVGSQQS